MVYSAKNKHQNNGLSTSHPVLDRWKDLVSSVATTGNNNVSKDGVGNDRKLSYLLLMSGRYLHILGDKKKFEWDIDLA